jgi:hypothetical protein
MTTWMQSIKLGFTFLECVNPKYGSGLARAALGETRELVPPLFPAHEEKVTAKNESNHSNFSHL